jgi:hypothetical protein
MSTDKNPKPRISYSKLAIVLWSIYLAAIFGFGWYKSAENSRDELATRTWQARFQQLQKDGNLEYQRLIAHFDVLHGTPNSQRKLEEELNGGRPFAAGGVSSEPTFEWSDPTYGSHFKFEFRDGVLVGNSGGWGTDSLLRVCPQPPYNSRQNIAEQIRRPLVRTGIFTWLGALIGWFALRNWRLLAAQVSLAAALLVGMAWLTNPYYSVTSQGIFSNDNLFFAALMLLVSAALLGLSFASRPSAWQLRFGLFDLLVAVTFTAMLLAIGPFGYVTIVAGVAVALMVAASFYFSREAPNPSC